MNLIILVTSLTEDRMIIMIDMDPVGLEVPIGKIIEKLINQVIIATDHPDITKIMINTIIDGCIAVRIGNLIITKSLIKDLAKITRVKTVIIII